MASRQEPTRERASQCLNLAHEVPSWVDTDTLRRIVGDYLQLSYPGREGAVTDRRLNFLDAAADHIAAESDVTVGKEESRVPRGAGTIFELWLTPYER
jgi:hypothetical protein